MSNYKLTNETIILNSVILFRIELIVDCKWGSKGSKGGYIKKLENLSGDAWVSGDALVYGNARVYGNAHVSGDARVYGNAQVYGDAHVSGDARVYGNARVSCDARVYGNAQVYGDARVYGDDWGKSPLQIQGTKHFFNICKKGFIKIGCIEKSIENWEKEFEIIGQQNNYTKQQIKEYGLYIQLAKQFNNL